MTSYGDYDGKMTSITSKIEKEGTFLLYYARVSPVCDISRRSCNDLENSVSRKL